MDRLVKADVKEVEIAFKKGQKCNTSFRLTNLMHTMSVAVSLTTTNPSLFSFNQLYSIIPPLSSSSYTLILSQPSDQPALSFPPHAITVKSSMLPTGKAHQDDLRRLFSKPGPHVFKDATIPISFVGPHVIEFLISQHTQIPELNSIFNKAVSACTGYQLSVLLKSAVVSGNENLVTNLIDNGADVNYKDSDGRSMISLAVKRGHSDVVKLLIASGCKASDSIVHVLHDAAAMNRVDLMEVLISAFGNTIDVNSVDSSGRTPIHIAASKGHAQVIQFCASLAEAQTVVFDKTGSTPLHLAAENGRLEAVKCLLDCSEYVKYILNKEGKTAFTVAVENGHTHLYDLLQLGDVLQRAARVEDIHGLKSCLAEGAKVNGRDQNGWTPLHRAAFKGKIESVKLLLNHGANVDLVDDAGYTPLLCAVMAGHVQVALLLIAHGARANVKSLKRLVPLNLDCFKNHASLTLLAQPLCHEQERT
ncbi:poly [ADP-ribose] polymerase tankyrase-2-like [Pistacia vera]|uniref:poly [ADP-ribose] polymerase tankyrase-2-like n=1 Tax=Pistacia vera TaxID=55513 RepID=UPI001263C53E|nr:poly [ADP-ribose] polymerase tankyrase-2-like [Pistacia vera]XP_031250864.1 poly [ADP-ribose] polymerase tankyrase-2-like [Pistacia vera]